MVNEYCHRDWKQQWEVKGNRVVNGKVDALMMKVNDSSDEPTVEVMDSASPRIDSSVLWTFEYQ